MVVQFCSTDSLKTIISCSRRMRSCYNHLNLFEIIYVDCEWIRWLSLLNTSLTLYDLSYLIGSFIDLTDVRDFRFDYYSCYSTKRIFLIDFIFKLLHVSFFWYDIKVSKYWNSRADSFFDKWTSTKTALVIWLFSRKQWIISESFSSRFHHLLHTDKFFTSIELYLIHFKWYYLWTKMI